MKEAGKEAQPTAGSHEPKGTVPTGGNSKHVANKNSEAQILRERSAELERKLAAVRADLAVARERQEFMQEEAEQARDYRNRLAREMARLERIQQALLPDQKVSFEVLRRLVATVTELEAQEESALEEYRSREAELRAEIADSAGESATSETIVPEGASGDNSAPRDNPGGPLSVAPGDEREASKADTRVGERREPRKGLVEGKALLSQGLQRIEWAHKAAAAERATLAMDLSRARLAVARRQRQEDATPRHAELLQYLSRFEELGLHAKEREKQLRKCQAERSMLGLTRETLAEESRALEAIAGSVDDSLKQKSAREAFLRQFDNMTEGVEASIANQTRLLDNLRERRRVAEQTEQMLNSERKRFLMAASELNEACLRYEGLNAHLALMGR